MMISIIGFIAIEDNWPLLPKDKSFSPAVCLRDHCGTPRTSKLRTGCRRRHQSLLSPTTRTIKPRWSIRCPPLLLLLHFLVIMLLSLSILSDATAENASSSNNDVIKAKICIGTNGRMSVPQNREHHYRNLRDRYTNCTYVDGNLELTWLQDEHMDLSFLQYIREVTGYVLMSHVHISRIVLPSLQIIRGRTLFKVTVEERPFALFVTLSYMHNVEMPALRDILEGSVGFYHNYNLCHVQTINWEEILTGPNARYFYVYNFTTPERECSQCDPSCTYGCWGEGPDNCQKFSKINCSPQCYQGRCFGKKPRECCHLFCAGGCTGPKQTDCLACRSVYNDGVCAEECPPMQRYNPITYSWEPNPNGKYAYGATCVTNCPEHLLKDNGACVKTCPINKKAVDGECVPCDGPCPKTCLGEDAIHSDNIDNFKDCTVIEGSVSILDQTFKGFHHFSENYSTANKILPMHPDRLEIFSTLKEITGYLNIQGYHDAFTNLSYFRNLEMIGGRELYPNYFASVYIVKTSLKFLGFTALKKIMSGGVAILENKHLCYVQNIDWKRIKKSVEHGSLLQNNKKPEQCQRDREVCDVECSSEGCWGPGSHQCISCSHYKYKEVCIPNCDAIPGLYKIGPNICMPCHKECDSVCNGPGAENCKICRHVRDGPYCISSCPTGKYNSSGECKACHRNCVGGCYGPDNTISSKGCVSCDKAVINGDVVERCLHKDENCPIGYYDEFVLPREQGAMKPLAGKAICRKCHPRCRQCTGYGFHEQVCQKCSNYKRGEQCEDECPIDYFADNHTHECLACSLECRGCYGPSSMQCISCKNFKVFQNVDSGRNGSAAFNCTSICPPELPHKAFPEENGEPYCTIETSQPIYSSDDRNVPVILGAVLASTSVLILFLIVLGYQWHQRAAKDHAVKMTMVLTGLEDNVPLHPSNVKPNLAKLRIVKEAEMRKGGVLGFGAFGTVFKGVWVPEGENVKIPVAIKVLREGTGANTSKEFLEEAYIMASVDHPNLLQLLAVCMTSQMMLITQLMPLGCLLDYVRNNSDKIGSKPLLIWCTQIAKGMAYLEEKRLVHRDLAARNVLVQTPNCVKITDFGLAKLLDINEEEYKAAGGKMPIKWLALECIQHRIFTHKSDVWAFGVTIWELLTYGGRPYENVAARDVPELLEKGERLPQPAICTIDVYMIMIKCWMLDAESRPSFKELAEEFAKMSHDPGRYLFIQGDRFMRLPSYTYQDEKEIIRTIAMEVDDTLVDSEEYLQPKVQGPTCSGMPSPSSDGQNQPNWNRDIMQLRQALNHPANRHCVGFVNRESDTSDEVSGGSSKREAQVGNLKLDLPLDDDDYLMPSPQTGQSVTTTATSTAYMDLIGGNDGVQNPDENQNNRRMVYSNTAAEFNPNQTSVDNPEYHLMSDDQKLGIPRVRFGQQKSSEEESDHEYYNDFDRLQRELQPLRRNETTV